MIKWFKENFEENIALEMQELYIESIHKLKDFGFYDFLETQIFNEWILNSSFFAVWKSNKYTVELFFKKTQSDIIKIDRIKRGEDVCFDKSNTGGAIFYLVYCSMYLVCKKENNFSLFNKFVRQVFYSFIVWSDIIFNFNQVEYIFGNYHLISFNKKLIAEIAEIKASSNLKSESFKRQWFDYNKRSLEKDISNSNKDNKNELKYFIGNNDFENFFKKIKTLDIENVNLTEIIHLENRFNRIKKDKGLGVIEQSYYIEENRISLECLNWIENTFE